MLDYFKFTIVRNPWDREVSAYIYLKSGGMEPADRQWADEELANFKSFDDFIRNWLTSKNIWLGYHFQPQWHFISSGALPVNMDFVGRFERLDEDFQLICGRLGRICDLPRHNHSSRRDYRSYYTDETRRIVAQVYADDIERFGYTF